MGFGGAVFVIYFAPVVMHYFTPKQRPTINALNSCAYNFGSIVALLIVGPIINIFQTWQRVWDSSFVSVVFFLSYGVYLVKISN